MRSSQGRDQSPHGGLESGDDLAVLLAGAAVAAAGPLVGAARVDGHLGLLAGGHAHLVVGLGDLEQDGAGSHLTLLDQDGLDQNGRARLVVQDDWGLTHDHRWVVDEDAAWGWSHIDRGLTVQVDLLALLATAAGPHNMGLRHLGAVVLLGRLLALAGTWVASVARLGLGAAWAVVGALATAFLLRRLIAHGLDVAGTAESSLDALDQQAVRAGDVAGLLLARVVLLLGFASA